MFVWYENVRRRLLGAQSINTERDSLTTQLLLRYEDVPKMISRIQSHFRTAHPRLSARTTSSYKAANDNTSVLILCVHNILYGYLDPSAVCVFRAGKICVGFMSVIKNCGYCDCANWEIWWGSLGKRGSVTGIEMEQSRYLRIDAGWKPQKA